MSRTALASRKLSDEQPSVEPGPLQTTADELVQHYQGLVFVLLAIIMQASLVSSEQHQLVKETVELRVKARGLCYRHSKSRTLFCREEK